MKSLQEKCLFGRIVLGEKHVLGRNVILGEMSWGEMSWGRNVVGRNVIGEKNLWGETSRNHFDQFFKAKNLHLT